MDAIAVLNAGSSSIKFSLFVTRASDLELELHGEIEGLYTLPHFVAKRRDGTKVAEKSWNKRLKLGHDGALDYLIAFLKTQFDDDHLIRVGHRVLHGGTEYKWPVVVDEHVATVIKKLIPLAPLHQPHNLAPIRRLLDRAPEIPQVACFDTSFHTTNPDLAQRSWTSARWTREGSKSFCTTNRDCSACREFPVTCVRSSPQVTKEEWKQTIKRKCQQD